MSDRLDAQECLLAAYNDVSEVIILGREKNGTFYFATSSNDPDAVRELLVEGQKLMKDVDGFANV